MKQKIKVTREQAEEMLYSYAAVRKKIEDKDIEHSNWIKVGEFYVIFEFPDSIEVEVDVPDVVDAQEKLVAGMIKSMQPYKLDVSGQTTQAAILTRWEEHLIKQRMQKLSDSAHDPSKVIQSDLPSYESPGDHELLHIYDTDGNDIKFERAYFLCGKSVSKEEYESSPQFQIVQFCEDLKAKLIAKFEAGAKEHGDGWKEVDCWKEVGMEILDIINYFCMEKAK